MATNFDDVCSGESRSYFESLHDDLKNDDSYYNNTEFYYENYLDKEIKDRSELPTIRERMLKSQEYRIELDKFRAADINKSRQEIATILLIGNQLSEEVKSGKRQVSDLKEYNKVSKQYHDTYFAESKKKFDSKNPQYNEYAKKHGYDSMDSLRSDYDPFSDDFGHSWYSYY